MRVIAGKWGGRRIRAPRGSAVRPTTDRVRESWMAALGPKLIDAEVVDLFAGSGALGLEALSRGANSCVFVEQARGALTVLNENIEGLDAAEQSTVLRRDALAYVRNLAPSTFDLAVADPPYDRGLAAELLALFAKNPFADELWVEHRASEDIPEYPGMKQRTYGDITLTLVEK